VALGLGPLAGELGLGATSPALLGLMLTGWKPEVRMDESATSESSPSFLRQYTRMRTSSSKTRHTATAMRPTYRATSSGPEAAAERVWPWERQGWRAGKAVSGLHSRRMRSAPGGAQLSHGHLRCRHLCILALHLPLPGL
jgi:hypothetical protein